MDLKKNVEVLVDALKNKQGGSADNGDGEKADDKHKKMTAKVSGTRNEETRNREQLSDGESGGKTSERSAKNKVFGQLDQNERKEYDNDGATADGGRQRTVHIFNGTVQW